jgi:hypothetical protein
VLFPRMNLLDGVNRSQPVGYRTGVAREGPQQPEALEPTAQPRARMATGGQPRRDTADNSAASHDERGAPAQPGLQGGA